jgi:undecaprenyl-diphosphatase
MGERNTPLPLREAFALGLLHGPTELLPISSSAHTTLLAWRGHWRYATLEPAARKRFEVALHAGATAAQLLTARREIATEVRQGGAPRAVLLALASAPAALAGALLGRPIERRLGTPATIAAGLLAGSAAMALAEWRGSRERGRADAGPLDAVALGVAQAAALVPGVSRAAATRLAARARGFDSAAAEALSREVALPVMLGAVALKGREALRAERREWPALLSGTGAAFVSALASGALSRRSGRPAGSLLPFAAYRTSLAVAVLHRLVRSERR